MHETLVTKGASKYQKSFCKQNQTSGSVEMEQKGKHHGQTDRLSSTHQQKSREKVGIKICKK